jgi:hypothetical protein
VHPYLLHLSHRTKYTPHLLTLLTITFIPLALAVSSPFFPTRLAFFLVGAVPLAITHPNVLPFVLAWLNDAKTRRDIESFAQTFVDDDNLTDQTWSSPLREVELYENERWDDLARVPAVPGGKGGWSKDKLGDRPPWTRARDGSGGEGIRFVALLTTKY